MKKILNIIKLLILVIVIVFVLKFVDTVLYPQDINSSKWTEFYEFDNNTIDILHIGSSHSHRTFVPPVENELLNIDSFSMGMSGTSIEQIEYILEECVKHQRPKIITVEMFSIYDYDVEDYSSGVVHKAFDLMKFSKTKWDAINFNVTDDNKLEYFVPIKIYHLKWKEEDIGEYISNSLNPDFDIIPYYGYTPAFNLYSSIDGDRYIIEENSKEIVEEFNIERYKSLDRIVDICNENDIKLIFVASPYVTQMNFTSQELTKVVDSLKPYADENDIDIINYNKLMDEIGFDNTWLTDNGHLNIGGAVKVTEHLSNYIKDNYWDLIDDCVWDYEEESTEKFTELMQMHNDFLIKKERLLKENTLNFLCYENNLSEFLNQLNDERYITIISSKNSNQEFVNNDIRQSFSELGLKFDLPNSTEYSYAAVVSGLQAEKTFEVKSLDRIYIKNDDELIKSLDLPFELNILSSGVNTGSGSHISINKKKYYASQDGINIVVYDKYLKRVVNHTTFNTNISYQHYFDRGAASEKYNENQVIYSLDMDSKISNLIGAYDSIITEDGVIIESNSFNPSFRLEDYGNESTHILLRAEMDSLQAGVFEVRFNGVYERVQIVTGYNDVYIEINIEEPITELIIDPIDNKGECLIRNLSICDVQQ